MNTAKIALELRHIRKAFGPTVALDELTFSVADGSVHALLGENGAGKSTTVKMLSGLLRPDKGDISVFGEFVTMQSPRDAHVKGIHTAFQEMTQVKDLSVSQNLLLPYEPVNFLGQRSPRKSRLLAESGLAQLGLESIDPDALMSELDLPLRQKVEIARAVLRQPKVLLLDEPTSALSGKDMQWLGDIIARLRRAGTTIIFISHRMHEIRDYCDRLTVLRNGRAVCNSAVSDVSDAEIVKLIIGRSLSATFPPKGEHASTEPIALKTTSLRVGERVQDVSFALKRGEVLGVAALQGMGQLELFEACFGQRLPDHGKIEVDEQEVKLSSPSDAVRPNVGLGFVPEDRKTEGLFLRLSGRHNISLPVISRFSKGGILQNARESDAVGGALDLLQVAQRARDLQVSAFSGGNQQKMAIARWMLSGSRTLLMYDPTRGVDIGTKSEIYHLIRRFVEGGGAVLFYSTEIEEVVNLCDRVLVMYRGQVVKEMGGEEISEESIMHYALGHATASHAEYAA